MSKRNRILSDVISGMKQVDVARKYGVSEAYVSYVITSHKNKQKAEHFDFLKRIIERGAVKIISSKLSEDEIKRLEEME